MNYDDVFQKSDLGREEVKSQTQGILPREARTLLIMIDGKRDYRSYLDTLDQSKMFAGFGGITPILELLLELEYIEVVAETKTTSAAFSSQPVPSQQATSQLIDPQAAPPALDVNIETEFDRTFNDRQTSKIVEIGKSSIGNIFKGKRSYNDYETIKSDLATFIEKNAPPVEAWGFLLMLEQCENSQHLLRLVKEIQSTSNGDLARGMTVFIKKIQH